ncbi:retroviral-like aspartic protease family protein [Sphingomonas sp.]|uniref:retroviral-like aspartic protease family protein n=1 Tax=Sphingomonas sp. TaxID=28214 RepID=UPI002EDB99DA
MSRLEALTVMLGLAIAAPAHAQEAPACLPIETGDEGTPIIRARVEGQGPFAFVLDTAASGSTIDPARAAQLGLPRDARAEQAQGMGGGIAVHFHRVRSMEAGPVRLHDAVITAIPAPSFDSHDVAGLAGVDLLADRLTIWAPASGCVRVGAGGTRPAGGRWRPVAAKWLQPWKIMLPLRIGDAGGWALLDTGAQYTTLNPAFARRAGLDPTRLHAAGSIEGIDGRPLPLLQAEVGAVSLGPWQWKRRTVRVGALPVFDRLAGAGEALAILGMDWLTTEGFAVDYRNQSVWLMERPDSGEVR